MNSDVIQAFKCLFPLLQLGGIYAIQDLQTSYWAVYGGNMYDLQAPGTSINFLKGLVDALNYRERDVERAPSTQLERHTVGVHFHHNLCFVEKGVNDGPSSVLPAPIDVPTVLPSEMCERVRGKSDVQLEPVLRSIGGVDGILQHVADTIALHFRHVAQGSTVRGRAVVEYGTTVGTLELPLRIERRDFEGAEPLFEVRMSAHDWTRLLTGNLSNIALLSGRASVCDKQRMLSALAACIGREPHRVGVRSATNEVVDH